MKAGKLARLIERQTHRVYFSELPVGTLFVILEEIDLPAYDLLGLFLAAKPHHLRDGSLHFTGYIERGSWEILGSVEDCIGFLRQSTDAKTTQLDTQ